MKKRFAGLNVRPFDHRRLGKCGAFLFLALAIGTYFGTHLVSDIKKHLKITL